MDEKIRIAGEMMTEYAGLTGISPSNPVPRRYLWTDSYAVCNLLGLYKQTGSEVFRDIAVRLIEQVHSTLGRHRRDDPRRGWISGLSEEEGTKHPTLGGLRIGKDLNERQPDEPLDERLEWERDGQYYHYLTQWMNALAFAGRTMKDQALVLWAIELAKTAHEKFTYAASKNEKRMYWKMSIDLSYPLVTSMGHHDPLDGLITYSELQATAREIGGLPELPGLNREISELAVMCEGKSWVTDDPLGIGGLLIGAYKMAELIARKSFSHPALLETVLKDSVKGLVFLMRGSPFGHPADYRLAFREFGLSIGLQAIVRLKVLLSQNPDVYKTISPEIERLMGYTHLSDLIDEFWMKRSGRESEIWKEHRDINMVMLATSLFPDGYLQAV